MVYFSLGAWPAQTGKQFVKQIAHLPQAWSVCVRARCGPNQPTVTLNLKPLLISVIVIKKFIASFASNVNITLAGFIRPVDFGPPSLRLRACCDSSDAIGILQWLCCLSSPLSLLKADDPTMAG